MDFLDSPSSDLVSSDLFDHQFRYNRGPILELGDEERLPIVPTVVAGASEWCEAHRERAGADVAATFIVNGEAFCADCYRGGHVNDCEVDGDTGDPRAAAIDRASKMRRRKERAKCMGSMGRAKCVRPFAPRISRKTQCVNGHPLQGENLRPNSSGRRICRACQRERVRKFKFLHRLEIAQGITAAAV